MIKSVNESVLNTIYRMVENGADVVDAVISASEIHNIEIEQAAKLVKQNSTIKSLVEAHSRKMNLLKEPEPEQEGLDDIF